MRCRAHGGMKIRESDTRTSRDRVEVDTVSGETRLFSRENGEWRMGRATGRAATVRTRLGNAVLVVETLRTRLYHCIY
jgi:hypothetical protein